MFCQLCSVFNLDSFVYVLSSVLCIERVPSCICCIYLHMLHKYKREHTYYHSRTIVTNYLQESLECPALLPLLLSSSLHQHVSISPSHRLLRSSNELCLPGSVSLQPWTPCTALTTSFLFWFYAFISFFIPIIYPVTKEELE